MNFGKYKIDEFYLIMICGFLITSILYHLCLFQ